MSTVLLSLGMWEGKLFWGGTRGNGGPPLTGGGSWYMEGGGAPVEIEGVRAGICTSPQYIFG